MLQEIFNYEEENIILERNRINDEQALQLAALGFINIGNQRWFRKCRYDSVLAAENGKQPGDIIVEHRTAVFVLTRDHSKASASPRALVYAGDDFISPVRTDLNHEHIID